ncbi:MAG: hypothetical protein NZL85_06890, partial [Fimbriimonadales bacterium]|nr:hypothetical protein [Fimbriimonadales bacterium]
MRFLTCRAQPDSPPCLAVWIESDWFQLKGCRDFGDWLRRAPAEQEQLLATAQPVTPAVYLPPVLTPPSL